MLPIRFQQSARVEPVGPRQRGELERIEASPWTAPIDDFGLVNAVDRLARALAVAYTAD